MRRVTVSPLQVGLILLLAGLIVVLLLLSRRGGTEHPDRSGPAAAFDAAAVRELRFQKPNVSVRVVREPDGFWITEPYRDRADDVFLAQSLKVASNLAPLRTLPDTVGTPFGLSPPRAVWRCTWSGGVYEIALGDSLPAGGGRFARAGGKPHVLVLDSFTARRYLSPPVVDIHCPRAALLDVGPIDSVLIRTREEEIAAVRHRADFWEFVRPLRVEGSAGQLARAVEALRSDGLTEFLGPTDRQDLKSLGLDPPRATWTLIQGTRRQTIRIGHPTSDEESVHIVPAGRNVVALIASENFRQWVDGLSRLRETLVLATPAQAVLRVEARGGSGGRLFAREPGGVWREIAEASTLEVQSNAFSRLIENTVSLRAQAFREGPAPGRFPGEIRLLMCLESGVTDTLRLARPLGEASLAWSRRQPGVCEVSADAYRAWRRWLDRPLRP